MNSKNKFYAFIGISCIITFVVVNEFWIAGFREKQACKQTINQVLGTQRTVDGFVPSQLKLKLYDLVELDQSALFNYIIERVDENDKSTLVEIDGAHTYTSKSGVAVETYPFKTTGDFRSQLVLLDSLEQSYPGSIRSVHFYTKKNSYQQDEKLYTQFYFQRSIAAASL